MADLSAYEESLEQLYDQADLASGLDVASTRTRRRNMLELRRRSLQIDQFLTGDFSSLRYELRKAFPSSHSTMPLRIYPTLSRTAYELATLYARSPRRLFLSGSGNTMDQPTYQKMRDIYDRSVIDDRLLRSHRNLIGQQTQVLLVLPAGPRKVTLLPLSPYQVFVRPGNALTADDITTAAEVRLKLPVAADDVTTALGYLVLTPTQAYWDVDGTKSSVFNPRDKNDLRNPWPGSIPLIGVHSATPPPGHFIAPLADDLLHEQIGTCMAVSQLEHMARHSGPKMVIEPGEGGGLTQELAEGLPAGADTWIALPGAGSKLAVVQPQPLLGEYRALLDWQIGMSAIMHDMSPDAFSKSPAAKTSVSRAYDRADRAEHRRTFGRIFEPIETELAQLIAKVSNLDSQDGILLPEDVQVRIDWAEPEDDPADPVHAAQARMMDFACGIDTPVSYLARQEGISLAAAEVKIRANITLWAQLKAMMPSDVNNIPDPGKVAP